MPPTQSQSPHPVHRVRCGRTTRSGQLNTDGSYETIRTGWGTRSPCTRSAPRNPRAMTSSVRRRSSSATAAMAAGHARPAPLCSAADSMRPTPSPYPRLQRPDRSGRTTRSVQSESGWVVRDDPNSAGNTITVYAICATEPAGYDVVSSSPLAFGDGGYGGWSCPVGTAVTGGGFAAIDPVAVSAPGTPGSVWPHYTFGAAEYGWVVRDDPDGVGNTITVYAVCAEVST